MSNGLYLNRILAADFFRRSSPQASCRVDESLATGSPQGQVGQVFVDVKKMVLAK
jgi:hypothetical protein